MHLHYQIESKGEMFVDPSIGYWANRISNERTFFLKAKLIILYQKPATKQTTKSCAFIVLLYLTLANFGILYLTKMSGKWINQLTDNYFEVDL